MKLIQKSRLAIRAELEASPNLRRFGSGWISGFPMNYTHWGAGQPNNPGSCIRARGTSPGGIPGEWWDQTCSQPYLVICVYHAQ